MDREYQEPNNTLASAKSVHLSASAGSGKTRALKDRYLALLGFLDRRGLGLDQAVAITFTDKAAAEIRERVLKDLSEPLLRKIVRGRQDLRISTIHSFCMNLLKRYPLEAGLPPDFGVLDERDRALTALRSIEDALETSDRDPGIMDPLREFASDDLIGMIEYLLSIRSRLKRIEIDAGGPQALLLSVRSGMGSDDAERELNGLIAGGEWRAHFRGMEELLRPLGEPYETCKGGAHLQLAQAIGVDAAALLTGSLYPVYFTNEGTPRKNPLIPKKGYSAGNRKEYEDAYAAVRGLLVRFRDLHALARAGREATSLLSLYFRAEERYQAAKLREGLLDFDDLEIYAYRLLKSAESPDILYWLDRKVLHYLVDEFQDTSDIQWAVLSRLTEEIFAGQGADKPMPPTLFVVGDEKQSIYRFREANYRLIENVRRRMEENIPPARREIRALDRNFRSVPEVIGTVNQVFTRIWEGSYRASRTERTVHAGSARLIELQSAPSGEDAPALSEAGVLAREIKKLIDSGVPVYEKTADSNPPQSPFSKEGAGPASPPPFNKGGQRGISPKGQRGLDDGWKTRPAGYGDCAILIQSRTKLKEYEAALLQEGIPYRVIGGIGFYEEDEVQAVLNTLFFLWNRDDRLSLAAALKSPLFGLTDNDIREVFSEGGDALPLLRERHPEAGELLHAWRSLAGLEPLAGMVHRIINESGAYIRFGRRNPQAVFNLDKLIDTAREFDRRGHTTLQDFVGWVRNIRETDQREATADMYLPGSQGAVSIMTVHKAKGLEFPVVLLPGMNQQARSITTGPPAIIESDGGVRMAIKDAGNPVYEELWEREKNERRREHQRLFYVAMTRARDHLVMIGTLNSGRSPLKPDTWLSYFHQAVPSQDDKGLAGDRISVSSYPEWRPAEAVPEQVHGAPAAGKEERPAPAVDAKAVFDNLARVPASGTGEWKKATDYLDEKKELHPEEQVGAPSGGISPLLRGSMLHRCLEDLARHGTCNLDRVAREFPAVGALAGNDRETFLREAGGLVSSLAANAELGWVFERNENAHSELPFLLRRGADLVSGVIDRVIIREKRGIVIDYKAIRIKDDADLASWNGHYLPQIRIYCEAVKQIFRLEAVEGYLLYLDSARLERVYLL